MIQYPVAHIEPGRPVPELPAVASGKLGAIKACAFCGRRVQYTRGRMIPNYWGAVDELADNVALTMECGERPRPGWGAGSFFQHSPK